MVVGLQGDAADVRVAREEQEGLGDDAHPAVADKLQPHGAGADRPLRPVQAQVAAAPVVIGTWVGA